jgi:hypothetical protein
LLDADEAGELESGALGDAGLTVLSVLTVVSSFTFSDSLGKERDCSLIGAGVMGSVSQPARNKVIRKQAAIRRVEARETRQLSGFNVKPTGFKR